MYICNMKDQEYKVFVEEKLPEGTAPIDLTTGEVKEMVIQEHVHKVKDDKEFVLCYVHFLNAMKRDMTLAEICVFAFLIERYGDGREFAVNKPMRELICQETKITNAGTVSNIIKSLCDKEIPMLIKLDRGLYRVNPRYAFKGRHDLRNKHLETIIFKLKKKA